MAGMRMCARAARRALPVPEAAAARERQVLGGMTVLLRNKLGPVTHVLKASLWPEKMELLL